MRRSASRGCSATARADAWGSELAALPATVCERVATAAARNGGAIPPALDSGGGLDRANLRAAWPEPVLDPMSPLVARTLASARGRFREGLATCGPFHNLHHHLGFRVFETGVRPYARRTVDDNLAPHGWFAAELVALIRTMLVRPRRRARAAVGGPGRWLVPGRATVVRGASTKLGAVDVSLRPARGVAG